MEANPVSLTPAKLGLARSSGVNRISLGVQSFEPELLKRMGRAHDADQARTALDLVAGSGLRWSADQIFALPGQTLDQFLSSLETLLSWKPSHVSFYGLTLEPGTDFWKQHEAGKLQEADEDLYADMYLQGVEFLADAGICRYEVSNFAVPGQECRHNEAYWDTRSTWLAAGNAAHGYEPHLRWRNPRGLGAWSEWVDAGCPVQGVAAEELDLEERWTEGMVFGASPRARGGLGKVACGVSGEVGSHGRHRAQDRRRPGGCRCRYCPVGGGWMAFAGCHRGGVVGVVASRPIVHLSFRQFRSFTGEHHASTRYLRNFCPFRFGGICSTPNGELRQSIRS
jgi:hypothetical protein